MNIIEHRLGSTDLATTPVVELDAVVEGVAWRWTGWASWTLSPVIVCLAALTVVVDAASAWSDRPLGHLGPAALSPALPLALAFVALVGPRRMGLSRRSVLASREFLATTIVVLVVGAQYYTVFIGPWSHVAGLLVAGIGEEVVYRAATVVVVGALLARARGRNWRDTAAWGSGPMIGAIVVASVVFSALPGHVEQMTGPMEVVPFASLGIVLGYVMMRTGSVLTIAIAHVLVDLAAMSYLRGALADEARVAFSGLLLVSLLATAVLAGRRLGRMRRVPAVIDLRSIEDEVAVLHER